MKSSPDCGIYGLCDEICAPPSNWIVDTGIPILEKLAERSLRIISVFHLHRNSMIIILQLGGAFRGCEVIVASGWL